ncbi:hypothetical protein BJ878DRAFT_242945 [Calycina marina]|uniref:Uncharacterized protein n=1 Tax=Calycina marina TaxID=1763456 RepID=A0A9P7YX14_9HELO|nr:hypothetical protein BJ878DRAFT_242945 [Calycina marina]
MERLIKSKVVFGSVTMLTIASALGIAIGVTAFVLNRTTAVTINAANRLLLLACLLSILYDGLHIRAAIVNELVGVTRPANAKTYGMCFVAAKIVTLFWAIPMITWWAVLAKSSMCLADGLSWKLQAVPVSVSTVAFTSAGIIMASLEFCKQPFEVLSYLYAHLFGRNKTAEDL